MLLVFEDRLHLLKNHEGKGIGKQLFQLAPEPVQLKVTENNTHAIEFYKKQGIEFETTFKGKKDIL